MRLERVVVDAELREKLMAPLCHRIAVGDEVSVFDVPRARILVLHEPVADGRPSPASPCCPIRGACPTHGQRFPGAWILAETGEVSHGTMRKELLEGTLVLDGGQSSIVLALSGAVVPLPGVDAA